MGASVVGRLEVVVIVVCSVGEVVGVAVVVGEAPVVKIKSTFLYSNKNTVCTEQ